MLHAQTGVAPGVDLVIDYVKKHGLTTGDRLPPIKELAAEWSLAPHAVRDALLHAQAIGVVTVRPRSGAYVQSVSFSPLVGAFAKALPRAVSASDTNLLDLLEARRVIECEMTGIAAVRRRLADLVPVRESLTSMYQPAGYAEYVSHNQEFHLQIARIAGNQVLLIVLKHLMELLRTVLVERQPHAWENQANQKRLTDEREHEAIFQALLAGDPKAAKAAMSEHLRDTTESLVSSPVIGQSKF